LRYTDSRGDIFIDRRFLTGQSSPKEPERMDQSSSSG
jgi:hypothetical protein